MSEKQTGKSLFPDVYRCVHGNFRMFTRILTQYYDARLAPAGILITQFMLLSAIDHMEQAQITPLADMLLMDRTTLTRNLKVLEKKGWIEIQAGTDQRTRIVQLRDDGKAIMSRAYPLWIKTQTEVEAKLGSEYWDTIRNDLHELIAQLH
jgi:DNA-binding MarR family transcriptional regulator